MIQGELSHYKSLLSEERSSSANLEKQLESNNKVLASMTKQLHRVSFIMMSSGSGATDDDNYQLKLENELLKKTVADYKLTFEEGSKNLEQIRKLKEQRDEFKV